MDFSALDLMYANPHDFYSHNFFGIQQSEIYQSPNLNNSASGFGSFGDIFRFEDGSGDASGSLHSYRSSYIEFGGVQGQGQGQNETEDGGVSGIGGQSDVGSRGSSGTTTATMTASSTMILSSRPSRFEFDEMNRNVMQPSMVIAEQGQQQYQREQTGISMSFSMLLGEPTHSMNPNIFPPVDGVPFIMVGQERFELEPETIFVLGMRLNVTKNDILGFFSSMGMVDTDNAKKPKIFVYKNRQTGRSKGEATVTYINPFMAESAIRHLNGRNFMGETVTVLPAYLSTLKGRGIRYRYPREFAPSNIRERQQDRQQQYWQQQYRQQQDRQQQSRLHRPRKWIPPLDNWFCKLCRNSNFVWRSNCNRCNGSKSKYEAEPLFKSAEFFMRAARAWRTEKADWYCCYCFNKNYWYRKKCNRCQAPRADDISNPVAPPRLDKWELELGSA